MTRYFKEITKVPNEIDIERKEIGMEAKEIASC